MLVKLKSVVTNWDFGKLSTQGGEIMEITLVVGLVFLLAVAIALVGFVLVKVVVEMLRDSKRR